MISSKNQFGLTRLISEDIKRVVRKRCSFCCVLCDAGVYQYHHFKPDYKDATIHDPDGITLLCGTHHDQVTRGFIRPDEVAIADTRRRNNPQDALIRRMTIGEPFIAAIGSIWRLGLGDILKIDDVPIISTAVDESGLLVLDAKIFDDAGKECVRIISNELVVKAVNWDVITSAGTLKIKNASSDLVFDMVVAPPIGLLIRCMNMQWGSGTVRTSDEGIEILGGGARIDVTDFLIIAQGTIVITKEGNGIQGGSALMSTLPGVSKKILEAFECGDLNTVESLLGTELTRFR